MGNVFLIGSKTGSFKEIAPGITMEESTTNGFYFNEKYIPEEILSLILSYVPPKELLKATLVCKNWNAKIKDNSVWLEIYKRKYPHKKFKHFPWYVYYVLFARDFFDCNLLKNVNGKDGLEGWFVIENFGDGWLVESVPQGAQPLPENVPEFEGQLSCFATSFHSCTKQQMIYFGRSAVYRKILTEYKPTIYVSEWTSARFDCASSYRMRVSFIADNNVERSYEQKVAFEQWCDPQWQKVELVIDNYPDNMNILVFEHKGKDRQFWKGHFGSKMAGAVVKILFDSLKTK